MNLPTAVSTAKRKREPENSGGEGHEAERWPPDLCERLQEHSFCQIQLRCEEVELLRQLDTRARTMFASPEARDTLKPLRVSPQPSAETHPDQEECMFVGLQRLKQRAIFRVRRLGAGLDMPWPCTTPLHLAAAPVLDFLESLAEQLVRKVLLHAGLDPDDSFFARHCRTAARVSILGSMEIDSSPLDLFWYPNEATLCHIDNCTPHYDPGFLAIAIASKDPGFRVWDVGNREWVSGAASDGKGPCTVALQDAFVFVGESLSNVTGGMYPACCHAVDRHSSARLGIVYEMQALGGKALAFRAGGVGEGSGGGGEGGVPASETSRGECILTVGACVEGLEGMSVVQVFSLACSCPLVTGASRGQARDTSGSPGGCLRSYCLVKLLADDESADEEEADEEEGAHSVEENVGRDAERREKGEVDDGSLGGGESGGGHGIHVKRPLCTQLHCARCRCQSTSSTGNSDGEGCDVDLGAFAAGLISLLRFDKQSGALSLASET